MSWNYVIFFLHNSLTLYKIHIIFFNFPKTILERFSPVEVFVGIQFLNLSYVYSLVSLQTYQVPSHCVLWKLYINISPTFTLYYTQLFLVIIVMRAIAGICIKFIAIWLLLKILYEKITNKNLLLLWHNSYQ